MIQNFVNLKENKVKFKPTEFLKNGKKKTLIVM